MAGVTAAAVTKQLKTRLAGALEGQRIDANHPEARKYLQEKTAPKPQEPATGVDPLFEQALKNCQESGRWTGSHVMRSLGIGYARAVRLLEQLASAGHCPAPEPAPVSSQTGQSRPPPAPPKDENPQGLPDIIEAPDDLSSLIGWTLGRLLLTYGTATRFHDWLKALKEIEMVCEKRIKNAQLEGKLVNRDLVKSAIIDRIDGVFVKLLTDGTTTISSRAHAMVKAGETEAEVKAMVEDQLGSFIRPAKDQMRRALDA